MLMRDSVIAHGWFIVEVNRGDSNKKEVYIVQNRVVRQGRWFMLRNTVGVNTVSIDYVAVSNSNTAVSDTETQLPGTFRNAKTATKSRVSATTVQWQASWSAGELNGQTIYSYALVTETTNYTEFSRVVHSTGITFGANDTLSVTYQLTLTAS